MSRYKTPLRYPGGKQKLTPFIKDIIHQNGINGHYVEPYAGGAGVALELLLNKEVSNIHLNDSNIGIYSFWYSVINFTEEFCRLISTATLTIDEWKKRKAIVSNPLSVDLLELGFSIFYLNRCNRSGVLSAGMIGGYQQLGKWKMDARFNRNDLIRRVEAIGIYKNQIQITNYDAEYYIENYIPNLSKDTIVYLDPPYYEKARDLYLNSYHKSDHSRLAEVIQNKIEHKWVLSYDGVPEIINLYKQRRHFLYDLQYTAAKAYKGKEVFIFCDDLNLPTTCKLKHIDSGIQNLISNNPIRPSLII